MVDDFLPRRVPSAARVQPGGPSPQLTRAQPFLRAGQLNRRAASEQGQTARFGSASDEGPQPDYGFITNRPDPATGQTAPPPPPKTTKPGRSGRFKKWWSGLSKRAKILWICGLVVLLAGIGAAVYLLFLKSDPAPPAARKATPAKTQVTTPAKAVKAISKLTGMEVDPAITEKSVIGVMIENSPDARPQAGLNDAGVVFEAIAEGGITRFLALFQDKAPDYVGPVRSVRPYYVQWAMGFDASLAHAGGSGEALANIQDWKTRDLNHNGTYFWRISSRFAPHNLYTDINKLREYEAKKGYGKSNFTGFARKEKETKPTAAPTARVIDFDISGFYYNVHYDYIAETNSYARKVGGEAHMDDRSKQQLSPKVVIGLVMPYSLQANRIHSVYQTLGSGKAYIFQDGGVTEATWHKEDRAKNFRFTDSAGKDIKLTPGQTWLTALGNSGDVAYAP